MLSLILHRLLCVTLASAVVFVRFFNSCHQKSTICWQLPTKQLLTDYLCKEITWFLLWYNYVTFISVIMRLFIIIIIILLFFLRGNPWWIKNWKREVQIVWKCTLLWPVVITKTIIVIVVKREKRWKVQRGKLSYNVATLHHEYVASENAGALHCLLKLWCGCYNHAYILLLPFGWCWVTFSKHICLISALNSQQPETPPCSHVCIY